MKTFTRTLPLILLTALLLGCNPKTQKAPGRGGPSGPQTVPVVVASAVQKTIPVEFRTFGTVEPFSTVAMKCQVTGVITNIDFRDGQDVKEGDLLISVDSRQAENMLNQSEANLARNKAQLAETEREAWRQDELSKKGIASKDVYEQAKTAVEMLTAAIRSDEAAIRNSKLQVEYCAIRAPIGGRAGVRMVDQGNLVKANETTLLTINQIKPVKVTFALPQSLLPKVMKNWPASKMEARASLPGEAGRFEVGELGFVDNAVDKLTGTVQLKATFANNDLRLWPGLFVNVVLTLFTQKDAVVVPANAVQTGQKSAYVYVVKSDMTVEVRPVTADRTIDEETVVSAGLNAGETVVTDGQLRLAPGAKVTVGAPSESKKKPS